MIEDKELFIELMKEASELGREAAEKIRLRKYESIVFCGIGGSAFPGEFVRSLNLKIPVVVAREDFPEFADKKTLCFIISYSGNSEETINLYKRAKEKNCRIVIISSGGRLSLARELRVSIPKGYLPREAFVWLLFPVLNILKVNYKHCFRVIEEFETGEVKRIARKLVGKIPIVYSSGEELGFLGYKWQTFFNENSKALAHSNFFPELAHNEIESNYETKDRFVRLLLFDKKTRQIQQSEKIMKVLEIPLRGKELVSKLFYGTYFGFLLSYYVAEYEGIDYRDMDRINSLKH